MPWNAQEAKKWGIKGGAGRAKQIAAQTKARKEAIANGDLQILHDLSPIGALELKVSEQVQSGACGIKVERLAAMLAKLKTAEAKVATAQGKRYVHNNNYIQSSSTAPQGLTTQAPAQPMGSTTGGVPGPLKESPFAGPVGEAHPGGGSSGVGGGGVNTPMIPTAIQDTPITPMEITPMASSVPDTVPAQSALPGPIPCPGPGWVKVKIGTVWVWGRRNS